MSNIIQSKIALESVPDLGLDLHRSRKDFSESQRSAQFLDLPREIRDSVYVLLFLSDIPIYPSQDRAKISEYLGLLRTNHRIYAEAIEVLYGRNTFQARGNPAQKSTEFLNLLSSQRRDGFPHPSTWSLHVSKVCLARHALKKLYFPSYNIRLDRLKHLFSLLKYFPNLEYLKVVYESFGIKDMDVVSVCRLLRDRRPLLKNLELLKRISYGQAEDVSWMVGERPYRTWTKVVEDKNAPTMRHAWQNQDGQVREAVVINAPQAIPE